MTNKRLMLATPALLFSAFVAGIPAHAQMVPACYTAESLQGSFGAMGTYGANQAIAIAVRTFDSAGNMTSPFVINEPLAGSTTGARTILPGTNTATYAVNCDGSGVVTRVATAGGVTVPAYDDFLITEGAVQNGKLIAMTIVDTQRIPSGLVPGGVFLSRKYTRRPNGCYTQASMQGSYGVVVNYGFNVALAMQNETLDGKGNLTRTGVLNQPDPLSTTGGRSVGTVTSVGTYTLTCDGRGTISRVVTKPDGTKATAVDDFVISQGIDMGGGNLLATTILDVQRDPSVILAGGIVVTRVHTLRPSLSVPVPVTPGTVTTVAVAGPKNLTTTSRSIMLDGSASTSVDGKALAYSWTMAQGSPVGSILAGNTAMPTVQFSQGQGLYTFLLTVTDSTGATAQDTVTVNYRGF